MEFREFFKLHEDLSWKPLGMVIPTPPFGAVPSQWSGSDNWDQPLKSGGFQNTNWMDPQFDLMLPSVTKSSQIIQIKNLNNVKKPVLIHLADGTKLYIPYHTFKKIKVEPEVGKKLSVVFQRRADDNSIYPSDIKTIQCF